jgi:hypothetical protein
MSNIIAYWLLLDFTLASASPDPAQAGSALCVHFSRGVKNAG